MNVIDSDQFSANLNSSGGSASLEANTYAKDGEALRLVTSSSQKAVVEVDLHEILEVGKTYTVLIRSVVYQGDSFFYEFSPSSGFLLPSNEIVQSPNAAFSNDRYFCDKINGFGYFPLVIITYDANHRYLKISSGGGTTEGWLDSVAFAETAPLDSALEDYFSYETDSALNVHGHPLTNLLLVDTDNPYQNKAGQLELWTRTCAASAPVVVDPPEQQVWVGNDSATFCIKAGPYKQDLLSCDQYSPVEVDWVPEDVIVFEIHQKIRLLWRVLSKTDIMPVFQVWFADDVGSPEWIEVCSRTPAEIESITGFSETGEPLSRKDLELWVYFSLSSSGNLTTLLKGVRGSLESAFNTDVEHTITVNWGEDVFAKVGESLIADNSLLAVGQATLEVDELAVLNRELSYSEISSVANDCPYPTLFDWEHAYENVDKPIISTSSIYCIGNNFQWDTDVVRGYRSGIIVTGTSYTHPQQKEQGLRGTVTITGIAGLIYYEVPEVTFQIIIGPETAATVIT